jgi:hypothetical protein
MIQGNTLQTQDLPSASLFRCTPSLGATADMGVGLWRCKSLSPGSTFGLTGVNSRQRLSPKHPMKKGPSANEARNPKSEREHSGSLAFGHSIFGFRRLLGSLRVWVFGCLGLWVFGSLGIWVFGYFGIRHCPTTPVLAFFETCPFPDPP